MQGETSGGELDHQRDALRCVWSWYLGPMIPGLAVLVIGGELARKPPGLPQHHWIAFGVSVTIISLVFAGAGKLNQRAARRLQKRIEELDAAAKGQ